MWIRHTSLAALVVLITALPVAADQTDQRLETLFAELSTTQDSAAAQELQGQIWQIWYEHEDSAIVLLMRQGRSAMNRQDFRSAERSYDQVVAIAPDYAEGWNARATLYYLMGRHQDSLGDIDKTLSLEPRHFGALSGRGLVYAQLEDWDQALKSFEEALAVNPHMTGARINAEALRRELGDKDI